MGQTGQTGKIEKNELYEERKNNLKNVINAPTYQEMKRGELSILLSIPKEDKIVFDTMIDELIAEGIIFETKKGKLKSFVGTDLLTGQFLSSGKGYGFVEVAEKDKNDIYIPNDKLLGAMHNDTVVCKIIEPAVGDKKAVGAIVRVLVRETNRVVGTVEDHKNFIFVIPDGKFADKDIYISRKNSMDAVSGHKVVVEIKQYGQGKENHEGKVVEILGHKNDPGVDILSIIHRHNIDIEFPDAVYDEIASLPDEVADADLKDRIDFRSKTLITIDGADAKDLDDAVSCEKLSNGNYLLGVHIADVTHYVKEHTALDQEALKRGTSVYLVDRVVPMLPHKLSNGLCSLNPNVDRLALSCIMEINAKGDVVKHQICKTVIHSNYRMTYDDVAAIIDHKSDVLLLQYAPIITMLRQMNELRMVLGKKRVRRGAINFDVPESKVILDDIGSPIEIRPYDRNSATNLIEEFMLICNEVVAEDAFWQDIPFLYRNHGNPDTTKMERMEKFLKKFGYYLRKKDGEIHPRELQKVLSEIHGKDEEVILSRILLRSMMQAKYSDANEGHFGLASKYYTHFTSPIRRYPDLQIHRLMKLAISGKMTENKAKTYTENMGDVANRCSKRERIAEEAERDTVKMKKVEYMKKHLGESFSGIISSVTAWGAYVELDNTVEGMIPLSKMDDDYYIFDEENLCLIGRQTGTTHSMGDRVEITVVEVSKENATIDFAFAKEGDAFTARKFGKKSRKKKTTPVEPPIDVPEKMTKKEQQKAIEQLLGNHVFDKEVADIVEQMQKGIASKNATITKEESIPEQLQIQLDEVEKNKEKQKSVAATKKQPKDAINKRYTQPEIILEENPIPQKTKKAKKDIENYMPKKVVLEENKKDRILNEKLEKTKQVRRQKPPAEVDLEKLQRRKKMAKQKPGLGDLILGGLLGKKPTPQRPNTQKSTAKKTEQTRPKPPTKGRGNS